MFGGQKTEGDEKQITINTTAGTSHEGIPVEGMIETLKKQIQRREDSLSSLHEEIRDKVTLEINDLKQTLKTIEDNSISYKQAREDEGLTDPAFFEARKAFEAKIISEDELRKSKNPNDEERMKEDWANAEKALESRRELIFPKKVEDKTNEVLKKLEDYTGTGEYPYDNSAESDLGVSNPFGTEKSKTESSPTVTPPGRNR